LADDLAARVADRHDPEPSGVDPEAREKRG
jgi:hypothetical protein